MSSSFRFNSFDSILFDILLTCEKVDMRLGGMPD